MLETSIVSTCWSFIILRKIILVLTAAIKISTSVLRFWWILKLCRSIAWKFSETFYFHFLEMASTANLTTINIVPSSLSCLLIAIIFMCVCGFVVEMFQVILIKCSLLGCQEVCFACGSFLPFRNSQQFVRNTGFSLSPGRPPPLTVKTVADLWADRQRPVRYFEIDHLL